MNKNTKVTWTKKGKGATLNGRGTTATLMADLIMENNNVTVKAEAEDFPPAEITFNLKKPTRLTGKAPWPSNLKHSKATCQILV